MSFTRFGTRQVLLKLETTEGVDPTPTGLLNAVKTFEADLSIDSDTASRTPDLAWFSPDEKIEVGTRVKATFKADCLGASTAGNAAPISPVMQICGFAEVLTAGTKSDYNPITNSIPSGTFWFYQAGTLCKCVGARGEFEISRAPNSFGELMFTLTGIVEDDANVFSQTAIPTVDISAFRKVNPIVPATWSVVVNGFNVECVGNSIKGSGNGVNYIPTSENGRVYVTDRKLDSCTLSILLPDLTAFNPWALARAGTRMAMVDTVDGGATLKSKISAPAIQFFLPKKPFKNLKGGTQVDIPYACYPTSAGNDEIQFEFT